jgi:hypothetical protein
MPEPTPKSLKNNPISGRPTDIPGWAPFDLSTLTVDHIAREYCRIAFDGEQPANVRLKALKDLGQHLGMFIERKDVRTLDVTKQQALVSAFEQIPVEERIAWLEQQCANDPALPVHQQAALPPPNTPDQSQPTPIPAKTTPPPTKPQTEIPDLFK